MLLDGNFCLYCACDKPLTAETYSAARIIGALKNLTMNASIPFLRLIQMPSLYA